MIPNINLLPKLEKEKQVPIWLYIFIISSIAVVLAFFIFQYFTARSSVIELTIEQQQLTTERDELQTKLTTLKTVDKESLYEIVQFVQSVSYPITPLITEINQLLPKFTYLRSYEFTEEGVTLEVDFETFSSISEFVANLTASDYFNDAKLETIENFEVKETDKNSKSETFTMIPRYTVEIMLTINHDFLATVGGEQ